LLTAEQSLRWSIKEGILYERQYAISSRSLTSDSFLKGSDLYQVFTCRYTFLFEGFFFKEVIHLFFAEMVEYMKKIANEKGHLEIEERNLLSVAYKNVIGARRASWRVLSSLEKNQHDPSKTADIKSYREKVEQELKDICQDILKLLDDHLITNAKDAESKVFYHKM